MQRALFGLVCLSFFGCGGRQEPSGAAPASPIATPAAPAGGTAAYEVHEWGLLRAGAGDVLDVGAVAPPGTEVEPMAVDKPVLYFHASSPVRLERVRVEAIGGAIREHWPLAAGAVFPSFVEWNALALGEAHTAGGASCSGVFPSASARPCSDLASGEECESAGLGTLLSTSATCVESGATRLPFLFYRSRTSTFTPPVQLSRRPSGELQLTNAGDAPIPGWIVRMQRIGGQVRTLAVRAPGARETITLGNDFANARVPVAHTPPSDEDGVPVDQPALPGSQEPGRQAVRITLDQLGLDSGEADAFLRAWDGALFGDRAVPLIDLPRRAATSDRRGVNDVLTDESAPSTDDSILYFLPASACDGVARLSFTPAPTRVVRALAVWQLAR